MSFNDNQSMDEDLMLRQRALLDIYGSSREDDATDVVETEDMLVEARKQVHDALHMLPEDEHRQAYDEAMKECPQLVETESNVDSYLRVRKFDPWAAAKNIALYWKTRRDIFGDRAYLPMSMTGKGTLSEQAVEAMKCGGVGEILPSPDAHNRTVIVSLRDRLCSQCNNDSLLRAQICFYKLHVVSESEAAVKHGVVSLIVMGDSTPKKKDNPAEMKPTYATQRPAQRALSFLFSEVFPIRIRATHLVTLKRSILELVVPFWIRAVEKYNALAFRFVAHFAESKGQAMSYLKQYGFVEDNTPQEVGGKLVWKESFDRVWKKRLALEMKRYHPDTKPSPEENLSSNEGGSDSSDKKPQAESTVERKRRLDRLYQKNKREGEKRQIKELSEQIEKLQEAKHGLISEQSKLKALLDSAKIAAANHEEELQKKRQRQQQEQQLNDSIRLAQQASFPALSPVAAAVAAASVPQSPPVVPNLQSVNLNAAANALLASSSAGSAARSAISPWAEGVRTSNVFPPSQAYGLENQITQEQLLQLQLQRNASHVGGQLGGTLPLTSNVTPATSLASTTTAPSLTQQRQQLTLQDLIASNAAVPNPAQQALGVAAQILAPTNASSLQTAAAAAPTAGQVNIEGLQQQLPQSASSSVLEAVLDRLRRPPAGPGG